MKYIVSFIFLLITFVCNGQKKTNSSNVVEKVIIKKNDCLGECPVYTMSIQKDGKVQLEAKRFTPNKLAGDYTSMLAKYDWEVITKPDFATLKKSYGNLGYVDLASTDIEIHFSNGKVKKIHDHDNHGTSELVKLYEHIDMLFYKLHWKKVKY